MRTTDDASFFPRWTLRERGVIAPDERLPDFNPLAAHKTTLRQVYDGGVRAAERVCNARVDGAEIGSTHLVFEPGPIVAGDFEFKIGSAGSTLLVLQTVLPALLAADAPSTLRLEGGTHNPLAPSADFVEHAFLPVLRGMGAQVHVDLLRHGFFPAGGGQLRVRVTPAPLEDLLKL